MGTILEDQATQFLSDQGIETRLAFLGKSSYVIGREVILEELELVYRVEEREITICHFAAKHGPHGLGGAVAKLIGLIKKMQKSAPGITSLRALIFPDQSEPELDGARKRLADLMLEQGAQWRDQLGERWLVYSMH